MIALTYYILATKPLTQQALAQQHQILKINHDRIKGWWDAEVGNIREDLNNPEIISYSQLILRAKRQSRLTFKSPLSISLSRALNRHSLNRNSVSLLTKGGIVVFSTAQQKLGMYQPLNQTTTSLEPDQLSTKPLKFFTDSTSGKPAISMALPIQGDDQNRLGFLAIDLNLHRMNELVKTNNGHLSHKMEFKPPIQAYLAARTTLKHVTLIAPPASFPTSTIPASTIKPYQFKPLHSIGIQKALDGQSGQGLYLNPYSQPTIGVFEYLPNFRTALLVETLQRDVYTAARRKASIIFISGLSISLGLFFAGLLSPHASSSSSIAD